MRFHKARLVDLFKTMVKIRFFEESLVEPIIRGEIRCPCHLYSGQEAVAAGVCAALDKRDFIFGTHRSHGHFIAKGGDIKRLMAEIYGKDTGCSRGRGGSMHIIDVENGMLGSVPIVAGTVSLAVGAALGASIRKERRVTVSFFGDGATGEGVLYESLNFAALKRLPIIFACENNLYSTHLPIAEIRPNKNIALIARPFGIESHRVDGNDVLRVYESSRQAVEKCRQGRGPIFLEFATYRQRGHVGPDDNIQGDHTDIRPPEEVRKWAKKDPLRRFEKFLSENGILSPEDVEEIKRRISKDVLEAMAYAKKSPFPEKGGLGRHVFKDENIKI